MTAHINGPRSATDRCGRDRHRMRGIRYVSDAHHIIRTVRHRVRIIATDKGLIRIEPRLDGRNLFEAPLARRETEDIEQVISIVGDIRIVVIGRDRNGLAGVLYGLYIWMSRIRDIDRYRSLRKIRGI